MNYTPRNWYWQAADGRLFSSAKVALIQSDDADYLAFVADGNAASTWPADIAGAQTVAALQDVLEPYGLFADLTTYAADVRWRKETGGITVGGVPILTDDRSKQMLMGARIAASANPAFVTTWVGADGGSYPLNATQIVAVSDAVLDHVNACFAVFVSVVADIKSGATTTLAQIDAAFAA